MTSHTAYFIIVIIGIHSAFRVQEELIALCIMQGNAPGDDLFLELVWNCAGKSDKM